MLKTKSNALKVVEATLGKVTGVKKPVAKPAYAGRQVCYPHSGIVVRDELPVCVQQYVAVGQHYRKELP
jgi:hypothetical protein